MSVAHGVSRYPPRQERRAVTHEHEALALERSRHEHSHRDRSSSLDPDPRRSCHLQRGGGQQSELISLQCRPLLQPAERGREVGGIVWSPTDKCLPKRTVQVYRKVPGDDSRIGSAKTSNRGHLCRARYAGSRDLPRQCEEAEGRQHELQGRKVAFDQRPELIDLSFGSRDPSVAVPQSAHLLVDVAVGYPGIAIGLDRIEDE